MERRLPHVERNCVARATIVLSLYAVYAYYIHTKELVSIYPNLSYRREEKTTRLLNTTDSYAGNGPEESLWLDLCFV